MKINKRYDYIDNSKGVVIIVHGILEHLGRYDHVRTMLNESGYSTIRYDQRGHGLSEGKRGALKSFHNYIDDLHEIVLEANQEGFKKVFLLGHSMGGLVVNLYAAKYGDVDGIVSIGAATQTPDDIKILRKTGFWYLRWFRRNAKRLDNHLSRDPKVLERKKQDPLMVNHIYVSLAGEMFIKGVDYLHENINRLTQPFIYLHGGADKIVSPKYSEEIYEKIPSQDKELKIYDGAYHEILNEINKEEVFKDIITWLNKHL